VANLSFQLALVFERYSASVSDATRDLKQYGETTHTIVRLHGEAIGAPAALAERARVFIEVCRTCATRRLRDASSSRSTTSALLLCVRKYPRA
jgi:hypothetical protein